MDIVQTDPPELDLADSQKVALSGDRKRLIEDVQVLCEAVLGQAKVTIARLEGLSIGETIALDASPADPVELRINSKPIARGEIVTIDDRFGIRITQVG